MNNNYIDILSDLELKKKKLKRCLDIAQYDTDKRTEIFYEIKDINKEIEKTKFKINLERKMKKIENNNTNSTTN